SMTSSALYSQLTADLKCALSLPKVTFRLTKARAGLVRSSNPHDGSKAQSTRSPYFLLQFFIVMSYTTDDNRAIAPVDEMRNKESVPVAR
ncbi:MAG: hypothetical protein J7M34_08785, partial [Anaerolineae bacterium]|nr:hypothetical protein [Anaerolineae bacterium]